MPSPTACTRKGRLQLISAAFEPLLGQRANGGLGKPIDIFALFGSATSLGLGAPQIRTGLQIVSGIGTTGNAMLIRIIAVLTVAFVLSAVSGVAKGIQWLSNTNMVLALLLAFFIFVVGPTVFILNLVPHRGTGRRDRGVARGVDSLLLGLVSVVWSCILGGSAIDLQMNGVDIAGADGLEAQLFSTLESFPLATVTSILVMVLVAIFFVSSADAASIVMGTLSERGTQEPSRPHVIFWGVATGRWRRWCCSSAAAMPSVASRRARSSLRCPSSW